MKWLLDTNILLRFVQKRNALFSQLVDGIDSLRSGGESLFIVPQTIFEFWAVATRPVENNGLGMSLHETVEELAALENLFLLLPDSPEIYPAWRQLVISYQISGLKSHDARLVAAMLVHRIDKILTFNVPDFGKYSEITTVHPNKIH